MGDQDREWMRDDSPSLSVRWQRLPVAARWTIIAVAVLAAVLLIYYARVDQQNRTTFDEQLSMISALAEDDADTVDRIVAAHPSLVGNASEEIWGESLLEIACSSGAARCVRVLVARGADVNAADATGQRPLHAAVANGDADIVAALLESGADPAVVNEDGDTLLMLAFASSSNGQQQIVEQLTEYGAGVNLRGDGGMTPRHRAAWTGDVNGAKLLLEQPLTSAPRASSSSAISTAPGAGALVAGPLAANEAHPQPDSRPARPGR